MKQIIYVVGIIFMLTIPPFAQNKSSSVSPSDEREARLLAANFFNSYQRTNDLTPLIKKYFVTDFSRRLMFCKMTRECEGFARDFWKGEEEPRTIRPTKQDFLRGYTATIDYWSLYLQTARYLALSANQKLDDYDEKAMTSINLKLKSRLKGHPEVLKMDFWANPDAGWPKTDSVEQFRQQLKNFEKLISVLRIIESEAKVALKKSRPTINLHLAAIAFRVSSEENHMRFFDYPVGTKMIEVWPDGMEVPFKMDLIKENGKLRIVAIYPPID